MPSPVVADINPLLLSSLVFCCWSLSFAAVQCQQHASASFSTTRIRMWKLKKMRSVHYAKHLCRRLFQCDRGAHEGGGGFVKEQLQLSCDRSDLHPYNHRLARSHTDAAAVAVVETTSNAANTTRWPDFGPVSCYPYLGGFLSTVAIQYIMDVGPPHKPAQPLTSSTSLCLLSTTGALR
jgi:hypothetical protein